VYINPIVRSTIRVFSREFSAENTIVNKNTFTFDRFVGEISSFSLLDLRENLAFQSGISKSSRCLRWRFLAKALIASRARLDPEGHRAAVFFYYLPRVLRRSRKSF